MAVHGSPIAFTAILGKSEIALVFEKIIEVWPCFARFPDRKLENNITHPFVELLQRSAERRNWRFDFYYREKLTQARAPAEQGEGDIVVRPYPGGAKPAWFRA